MEIVGPLKPYLRCVTLAGAHHDQGNCVIMVRTYTVPVPLITAQGILEAITVLVLDVKHEFVLFDLCYRSYALQISPGFRE